MSTSQSLPTKKGYECLDSKLRFWGGKNTVMGGGLLAEAFMWPKECDNMRAEWRKRRDAKRAAPAITETVDSICEDSVEEVAEAHVTENGEAEEGANAENEDYAADSRVAEAETQAQKPASPASSRTPSVKSHHTSDKAQLPEAAEPLAGPRAPSAKSSSASPRPPEEDSGEKSSTSPLLSNAPSAKTASSKSVPPRPPDVSGGLEQSDKDASAHSSNDGAVKEHEAAPRLRGGGSPCKNQTVSTTGKQGRVRPAKLSVPNNTKSTASQSKEVSLQRASPASQRLRELPTQPQSSTEAHLVPSVPFATPTSPELNISRVHSIRPESSASCRISADPAALGLHRVTDVGRHWEDSRYRPGDYALSSTASIATTRPRSGRGVLDKSRKQTTQASPELGPTPLQCNRCGALCHCERERVAVHSKAPSQMTPIFHSHAASQKKTTSQALATIHTLPPNQTQASKPSSKHSSQSQPQAQTSPSNPQSQHNLWYNNLGLSSLSNRSRDGHPRAPPAQTHAQLQGLPPWCNPASTHAPSKLSSQHTVKPKQPACSSQGTPSQPPSHTPSTAKSQAPPQSQTTPNPVSPFSIPRPVAPQHAAVLSVRSTSSRAPQPQIQSQQATAVVHSLPSAPAPTQQPQRQSRTNNSAPVAPTQQQPRHAADHSTGGHSFVISWGHDSNHSERTVIGRLRDDSGGSGYTSSTSSDTGGVCLEFYNGYGESGSGTRGDGGWYWGF